MKKLTKSFDTIIICQIKYRDFLKFVDIILTEYSS